MFLKSIYQFSFEIPGLPKPTNQLNRLHWTKKRKEANHWKNQVALKCLSHKPLKPLKTACLILKRYSSVEPDFDGLVSSFKHCIDALVECGVLENDRISNIGCPTYGWEKVKKKEGKISIWIGETG